MPDVQPAQSAEPAQWLLRSAGDWWDLVRYGPPGFDVYVRIAFNPDPQGLDQDGEEPGLRLALGVLAAHTATPTTAYAAVWEGWTTALPPPPAPRVRIPNRTMLLFTGPVGVLRGTRRPWRGRAVGGGIRSRTSCGPGIEHGAWPARSTRRSSSPRDAPATQPMPLWKQCRVPSDGSFTGNRHPCTAIPPNSRVRYRLQIRTFQRRRLAAECRTCRQAPEASTFAGCRGVATLATDSPNLGESARACAGSDWATSTIIPPTGLRGISVGCMLLAVTEAGGA
jgi:hypothetical protein